MTSSTGTIRDVNTDHPPSVLVVLDNGSAAARWYANGKSMVFTQSDVGRSCEISGGLAYWDGLVPGATAPQGVQIIQVPIARERVTEYVELLKASSITEWVMHQDIVKDEWTLKAEARPGTWYGSTQSTNIFRFEHNGAFYAMEIYAGTLASDTPTKPKGPCSRCDGVGWSAMLFSVEDPCSQCGGEG